MQSTTENEDGVDSSNSNEFNINEESDQAIPNNVVIDIHSQSAYLALDSNNLNLANNEESGISCPYPLQIDESHRLTSNGTESDGKDDADVNKIGDGVYELPSYEESQREHGHIDGDLPPPYANDFPPDLPQSEGASSTTSRRQRQRRTEVSFGNSPTRTRCKYCRREVTTKLNHVPGTLTFIIMILIFFIGGFLLCCLLPLCIPGLKDVQHRCPDCNFVLGHYHRIG